MLDGRYNRFFFAWEEMFFLMQIIFIVLAAIQYGCRAKPLFVQFNGQCSSPQSCGVPQGSILGPLFFLLYINDLNNISAGIELILFADDTNLFMSHKDPVYLAASLNSELNYPLGLRLTNSP